MKNTSSFDNFKQRELQRGIETTSETEYKGYIIRLRAYNMSGISGKILKISDGRKFILRERTYNFKVPIDLLNELKNYIDDYEINLINKLTTKLTK